MNGFEAMPDACPIPPDHDEIERLAIALSKLPKRSDALEPQAHGYVEQDNY